MRTRLALSREIRRRAAPAAVALALLSLAPRAAASDRDVGFAAFLLDVGLPAEAAQELDGGENEVRVAVLARLS